MGEKAHRRKRQRREKTEISEGRARKEAIIIAQYFRGVHLGLAKQIGPHVTRVQLKTTKHAIRP